MTQCLVPPLLPIPRRPLCRMGLGDRAEQQRLDAGIRVQRDHTSQSRALDKAKGDREGREKARRLPVPGINIVARKSANTAADGDAGCRDR